MTSRDDGQHTPGGDAPRLSVLVPIKDERPALEQLVTEIGAALDGDSAPADLTWEAVLIDDGSVDGSWEEIARLAADDPRIRGLRLRYNAGKSAALAAGLRVASGDIIATLDGDLQDDPAELPGMVARLDDEVDLVAGHKAERRDPLTRRLASGVFNRITGLVTRLRLHDHNCGLKVGRREVFESVPLYGEMHRFLAAVSHARGFHVVEQPVNHRPRPYGSSNFGLERYLRGGLDLLTIITLTRYSRRPAHLFGGLGALTGTIGMLCLLYLTGVWFFTDDPIGTRPLLLFGVLAVLFSVQLLSVGLLAELIVNRDARLEDPLRLVASRTAPADNVRSPASGAHREAGQPEVTDRVEHPQHDRH